VACRRDRRTIAVGILVAGTIVIVTWGTRRTVRSAVEAAEPARRPPRISPDYTEIVVPPNLAPLNFVIREPGQQFVVRLHGEAGEAIEVVSRSPAIRIPPSPWRRLLAASRGRELRWDIFAQADGRWLRYQTIVNRVAAEDIDGYLVYRQIPPVYNRWHEVSIRQRNLTNWNDSLVLAGTTLDVACVNCHSFAGNDPRRMLLGLRSNRFGRATLLATDGNVVKLDTALGYTAWHPSGRLAAYSTNQVRQFFHGARDEVREVLDLESALAYYRLDAQDSKRVPGASDSQQLATYPTWSPDGRWLYYCRAPRLWTDDEAVPPARYAEVQYALMRIPYDIATDRWGEPETVLAAHQAGGSILLPRISPDGRFLLFCVCSHGCFPALEPTSDLYLLELATGTHGKPPINSEFSESWHSWSSNSRWIVFSSKRQGGTFTRPYLSYVDQSGQAHKPFVVPQSDPEFYDSFLQTFSVPELVTGPVPVSPAALARAARAEAIRVEDATGEASRVENSDPYLQADP
jgi:hypothetical protein